MGAEGLLSGWWSAFLPLLSPLSLSLSLSHKHTQTHQHTKTRMQISKDGTDSHTRTHTHTRGLIHSASDTNEKVRGANTLHTHAYAICRTSPSQPEDKGAVVARQQVSLAPTHLESASAPTFFQ